MVDGNTSGRKTADSEIGAVERPLLENKSGSHTAVCCVESGWMTAVLFLERLGPLDHERAVDTACVVRAVVTAVGAVGSLESG